MKVDLKRPQKLLLLYFLTALVLSFGIWVFAQSNQRVATRQGQKKQITTKSRTNLVRKSVDFSTTTGEIKEKVVTVNLVGFTEQDILNLKNGANKLEAVAFRMVKSDCAECPQTLKFGPELSDDTLALNSQAVSFIRPTNIKDDVIILDIEVPADAQINLIKNGEIIVAAKVANPMMLTKGRLRDGIGNSSTKKLAMWASLPIIQEKGFPQDKPPNK